VTQAFAVEPDRAISELLAGADFVDAFRLRIPATGIKAEDAAGAALSDMPSWITALLTLRNVLVTPLGLKPGPGADDPRERIGIFPIESITPQRVVLGFDDKHLDFRLVVDVAEARDASSVTATTLVRRHNLAGRMYLAGIMPFHKTIVPVLLSRLGRLSTSSSRPSTSAPL
jgi:hypothetical protein